MAKKVKGEDGKMYKVKKPFYKKVWFWVVVVLVVGAIGGGMGEDGAETESESTATKQTSKKAVEPTEKESSKTKESETEESKKDDVPKEYKSALNSAENYIDMMPFSEAGLYDQLTADTGDQFSDEAAQYAIDNIEVDYNEQALKSAETYQEDMDMSPDAIYDQLTSDVGEQFTADQAQYAVDNLSK